MSGYSYGNDDETAELNKIHAEVLANPDEFENWEKLVRAAEALEGGLNRNSSPQSITAARDVYDRFLARYPLFFGYWKKYADLEFSIAGTESAEYIYERGIASVTVSVDLWTHYCNFKVETCHEPQLIRDLFERGAESVGLDFLAHPFWDKYIDYEARFERDENVFEILGRLVHIPLHQYARYFERYRGLSNSRPLTELAPEPILQQFISDSKRVGQTKSWSQVDIERDVRARVDAYYMEIFHRTQGETTKRWTYEQEIKRPYFHVTELDEAQLANWTKYLDFEEAEGNFKRTSFLYERCLVACAHYDEYWQRYARWMYTQPGRFEEARTIFQRASYFYTPIARPAIRTQWALFEESQGRADVAADIYHAILLLMPDHEDAVVRLANLELRERGLDAAQAIYTQYIASAETPSDVRGALVGHAALLAYTATGGDPDRARAIFAQQRASLADSEPFWRSWLEFEARLPYSAGTKAFNSVRDVYSLIRSEARLPQDRIADLSRLYMRFLTERGGKDAAREWVELDALVNGSTVVVHTLRQRGVGALAGHDGAGGQAKDGGAVALTVNGH